MVKRKQTREALDAEAFALPESLSFENRATVLAREGGFKEMFAVRMSLIRRWVLLIIAFTSIALALTASPQWLLPLALARAHASGLTDEKQTLAPSAPLAVCADVWSATSTNNAPAGRYNHTAIWTGSQMIVWGGLAFPGGVLSFLNTGGRYNPSTDTWAATSTTNAPDARYEHTAIWTGSEMIVWGGENRNYLNTGGRYNPSTNAWTPTSLTNAPADRMGHTAVWTGSEMIIWGGFNHDGTLNTGARYNPATDSWTPISTTNAPSARYQHTAVWTGTEMIVWGGSDNNGLTNTGGRYNPATDTWTPISTSNAPTALASHTAIWTGSEMIVWGGQDNNGLTNTGGKYNPSTDTWTPLSTANAPSARYRHTAVWTGSEMIVWGGFDSPPHEANTGGRYNPSTDSWAATTTANAPTGRASHTAVWTGSQMIIWGGEDVNGPTNTGGRYCAASTPSSTFQFSQSSYQTANACASTIITVTRAGDTSQPASVDYQTVDGTATQKSDYTIALGTLSFAAGETSKTFTVLISKDGYAKGTETATLMLANPQNASLGAQSTAALQITDNQTQDSSTNPIDDPQIYVCQHYHDFLNREPDTAGLQFWTNQITSCNGDANCIDVKRQNVSAAYFLSREFQETGFFVIKVQRVAFGKVSSDASKRISYSQFLRDAQAVGQGFIDGQAGADQILDQNKTNYAQAVAGSQAFISKYPTSMTASQYVDALYQTANVTPQGSERQDAINAFGAGDTAGRAAVLRKVAESDSVKNAEFRSAFVLLQYFGYLRRNPTDAPDNNDGGYQFWLKKLNDANGDYIGSQMVRSFIISLEYRNRFGRQ